MFSPTSKATGDAIVIKEVPGEKALSRYVLTITNGGRQVFRYVMPDVGPDRLGFEAIFRINQR
jgi:hypothetical protein